MSDRDRLARNLKAAREARGVSQAEAADVVGKSRGTIANWEQPGGEFEPRSGEVETLAKLYGLSTQELRYADVGRGLTVTYADVLAQSGLGAARVHEKPPREAGAPPAAKEKGSRQPKSKRKRAS